MPPRPPPPLLLLFSRAHLTTAYDCWGKLSFKKKKHFNKPQEKVQKKLLPVFSRSSDRNNCCKKKNPPSPLRQFSTQHQLPFYTSNSLLGLSVFPLDRDQPVRLVSRLERELGRARVANAALRPLHQRRGLVPFLKDHFLYQSHRVCDLVPALAGAALDEDEPLVPGRRVDLALRAGV